MRKFAITGLAVLSLGTIATAQTAAEYEAGILDALSLRNCSFDASTPEDRLAFARQMSIHIGVPAAELVAKNGPHYARLTRAIGELADRGVVTVDGAMLTRTNCKR